MNDPASEFVTEEQARVHIQACDDVNDGMLGGLIKDLESARADFRSASARMGEFVKAIPTDKHLYADCVEFGNAAWRVVNAAADVISRSGRHFSRMIHETTAAHDERDRLRRELDAKTAALREASKASDQRRSEDMRRSAYEEGVAKASADLADARKRIGELQQEVSDLRVSKSRLREAVNRLKDNR